MAPEFPHLRVHGLHFAHPGRALWTGWCADWRPGVHAVIGGDGVGKSSLLRLLARQAKPQRGTITLALGRGPEQSAAPATDSVFWIDPRQPNLPPPSELTPAQWLTTLRARYPGWRANELAAHVSGWALASHLDKPFFALSTGTQRKFFMAAALASGAPLTLIDEPVAGLDKPSLTYLQQALHALTGGRERIVIVAHHEALPGVAWRSRLDLPD